MLWGWHFRWIGTGPGYWSNCAPNGIPPCSLIWIKKAPTYKVGDFVSYGYRQCFQKQAPGKPHDHDVNETVENTTHRIIATSGESWFKVGGLNPLNSDPAHWIKSEAINGKVVGVVYLPEAFWRWVSFDYSLKQDRAMLRQKAIWSLSTIGNLLTREGRERNWLRFSLADCSAQPIRLTNGNSIVQDLNGQWLVYRFDGRHGHILHKGAGWVMVSDDKRFILQTANSKAILLAADLESICSARFCSGELQKTPPLFFGSKVYLFGQDDNIWALDEFGSRILSRTGQANAMMQRDNTLFSGYMNMIEPPPTRLRGEKAIARK